MTPARWLTAVSAAQHYDFPSGRAFNTWAKRHDIPFVRRGSKILMYWSADVDKAIGADKLIGSEHRASAHA